MRSSTKVPKRVGCGGWRSSVRLALLAARLKGVDAALWVHRLFFFLVVGLWWRWRCLLLWWRWCLRLGRLHRRGEHLLLRLLGRRLLTLLRRRRRDRALSRLLRGCSPIASLLLWRNSSAWLLLLLLLRRWWTLLLAMLLELLFFTIRHLVFVAAFLSKEAIPQSRFAGFCRSLGWCRFFPQSQFSLRKGAGWFIRIGVTIVIGVHHFGRPRLECSATGVAIDSTINDYSRGRTITKVVLGFIMVRRWRWLLLLVALWRRLCVLLRRRGDRALLLLRRSSGPYVFALILSLRWGS